MFHDWKVGQQGWVRLRNGKIGRATVCSDVGLDCVRVDYIKDAHVSWLWISRSGHYHAGNGDSTNDAIEHLPDCTGFDWEPKFKVGDWVRIISHDGWCDGAKKEHPIGSYRKIADVEPFVYRIGDWVKVNTGNSRDLEHPHGAIRRIRAIEQRGLVRFFLFDGFSFGAFEEDVVPTHSPIDQPPPITWQLSAKVVVRSR